MDRRIPGRTGLVGLFLRPVLWLCLPALALVALSGLPGRTQQLPDPLTAAQQLSAQAQRLGAPDSVVSDLSTTTVLQPDPQSTRAPLLPTSRLEEILSRRAGVQLRQFGYSALGFGRPVTVSQAGALQDSYILGVGDEILVSLRGQEKENPELRVTVNRDGQVTLPRLNPISAAGRSLASFRADVEAAVSRAYVATNAFVSVGRVRQVSVLVAGEVNSPGQRVVSGLSSVLDAILLAGGVKKSGSLRNIRLLRGQREYVVDLYSVLTGAGGSPGLALMDGDRIRVPLLGATVAISGIVRQPGIFELPSGEKSITVRALKALAGGEEVRGLYRLSLLRVESDGRTNLVTLNDDGALVRDSDVLMVQFSADQTISRATLSGGISLAGSYPVAQGTRLSDILKLPGALGVNPYTLIGLISRRDPRTLLRTLTIFTPLAVLRGSEDLVLQTDDNVRPLSLNEARMLIAALQDYDQQVTRERDAQHNPVANVNVANVNPAQQSGASNTAPSGNLLINALSASGAGNGPSLTDRQSVQNFANTQQANSQTNTQQANSQTNTQQVNSQNGQNSPPGQAMQPEGMDASQNRNLDPATGRPPQQPQSQPFPENFIEQNNTPEYAPNREAQTLPQLAQQLGVDPLVLINVLGERRVTLSGAVRAPGGYLVGPNVPLQDLLTAAGGAVSWADISNVELISTSVDVGTGRSQTQLNRLPLNSGLLASYVVRPHDELRFNEVFNDANLGTVTVQGEVRFTGTYKLTRDERLSDLLARAGGLSAAAYPYGTIFLRKSAAIQEQESFQRAASQVQDQLMAAMTRIGNDKIDPTTFTSLQSFVTELRTQKAVGRIAIQADPSVLAANPSIDPLLEAGDVIYVPPRPGVISVYGQVMQPGSFPYRPGATMEDYLTQAGGYGRFADEGETFLVLPDGSARKVERSWLRLNKGTALPPGSAIVVPRDVTPFDLRQVIIDTTQILGQLAVSMASIAVISRN